MYKAPEDKEFVLKIGARLHNLGDLAEALDIMSDDTFKHHVTKTKNDFARWVRDVLQEEKKWQKSFSLKGKILMMR